MTVASLIGKDNSKCCGCTACFSSCPKRCISMKEDKEGFLYPSIAESSCIDCGLCVKTCPIANPYSNRTPLTICAAQHNSDDVRLRSSSGGVFSLLAEQVLTEGGVVFGAAFDKNWEVAHTYVENLLDLDKLRRSKYVQSRIGESYQQAKNFLKDGRIVLFTGSPCQIAGLLHFLRKKYDNLLTMDFVCHSAPSPKVWRKYLSEYCTRESIEGKNSVFQSLNVMPYIKGINFRDKEYGWKKYSFSLHLAKSLDEGEKNTVFRSPKDDNLYMRFFLSDTISRPSCHTCQAKYGKSGADITVGDYWWIDEIHPEFDDDKGCSVVYVFSDKGKQSIELVKYNCKILKTDTLSDIKKAYLLEGAFATPSKPNKTRTKFFSEYDHKSLEELTSLSIRVKSCSDKAFIVTKKIIKRIGIFNVAKQIYKSLR